MIMMRAGRNDVCVCYNVGVCKYVRVCIDLYVYVLVVSTVVFICLCVYTHLQLYTRIINTNYLMIKKASCHFRITTLKIIIYFVYILIEL